MPTPSHGGQVAAALLAVPLVLPWLASAPATMLAEMMPSMLNVAAPGAGGMRLRMREAAEFRERPFGYRLRRVYSFYALNAVPAVVFVIGALVFIHWVVSSARSR